MVLVDWRLPINHNEATMLYSNVRKILYVILLLRSPFVEVNIFTTAGDGWFGNGMLHVDDDATDYRFK